MNEQTIQLFGGLSDLLSTKVTTTGDKGVQFDQFLRERLMPVITAAQAAFADGRVDGGEIFRIVIATSSAVRDGLPLFNDTSKKVVVRETIQFIANELLPGDKAVKSTLLSDTVLDGVIEFAYRFFVKVRPAAPGGV